MITIKDVAKEAGVGVGTVSRYINGNVSIKNENKLLIDTAIKKLGYTVNPIARSMKTQKTMTVAVVVHSLTNMFSMKVIENIEATVGDYGYSILVAGCGGDEEKQYRRLSELKKRMIDGFVVLPVGTNAERVKSIVGDTPLILVDRLLDKNIFDSVTVDNETMVYEKMCEVIKLGFKKISIIEGPNFISNAVERKNGFFKALDKFSLTPMACVQKNYSTDGGFLGMQELLKMNFDTDAVFISNKEQSIGALKALNLIDKKIYIISFDDVELPWLINQPCTFIPQPIEEIGKKAAKLLIDRIGNPNKKIENIVIRE